MFEQLRFKASRNFLQKYCKTGRGKRTIFLPEVEKVPTCSFLRLLGEWRTPSKALGTTTKKKAVICGSSGDRGAN